MEAIVSARTRWQVALWWPLSANAWGSATRPCRVWAEFWADRPWERTHLTMQRQPEGPGCGLGGAAADTVSTCRSTQWFLSHWEHPSSAHSTPQLNTTSGADRYWEKTATEAAQISVSNATNSIPAATKPQPPVPAYSTPQHPTRLEMNTTVKMMQTSLLLSRTMNIYIVIHRSSVTT